MRSTRARSTPRRLLFAALAGGGAVTLGATAALAAPYATQATATAVHLSVISPAVVVDTGTETAANDGSEAQVIDSQQPLISLLGGQTVLTAGALGEVAVANNDGTSAACAGITGQGGAVELSDPQNCTSPGTAPVVLKLANLAAASVRLEADAITSTCTGLPDGTTTGKSTLVGARLVVDYPLLPDVVVAINTNVAPNTNLLDLVSPTVATLLSPVVSVTLNKQTALAPLPGEGHFGGLSVTAIEVDALSGALADASLANVTCGPSADLAIVPVVPLAGVPIALGTLAVAGGGVAVVTRKRRTAR